MWCHESVSENDVSVIHVKLTCGPMEATIIELFALVAVWKLPSLKYLLKLQSGSYHRCITCQTTAATQVLLSTFQKEEDGIHHHMAMFYHLKSFLVPGLC